MGLMWLATLGTNVALWFPGSGGALARTVNWYEKNYRTFIQPSVDRLKGIRPPLIKLKREANDIITGKPVFSIEDVQIIDFEKLNAQLKAQESIEISKARNLSQDDTSHEPEAVTSSFAAIVTNPNKYNITLTVKKDAYLGEIDFTDWKNHENDFAITIKNQEGDVIDSSSEEYQGVLKTLERVPLTLGGNSFLPDDSVQDKTAVRSQATGVRLIDGSMDFVKTFFDGKLRNVNVDALAGQNLHLSEDKFLEHLATLVEKIEDEKKEEIIDGYYKIIEQGISNDLLIIEKEKQIRKAEIVAREQEKKKSYKKAILIGVGITLLVVLGIALLIVFWPAGIAAGILAVTSFVTGIALQVAGFFAKLPLLSSLGIVGTTLGLAKASIEYQKKRLEIAHEELKNLQEGEKALRDMLDEIKGKKTSAKQVVQNMLELRDQKDQKDTVTIDLKDQKVEELGTRIINKFFNKFLQDPQWQPQWKQLKLSLANCGITQKAIAGVINTKNQEIVAEGLAGLLENNQANRLRIQEIDISSNPIGSSGIMTLSQALEKNFTLTALTYDIVYKGTDDKTITDIVDESTQATIAKNLILNRYLQNPDLTVTKLVEGIEQKQQDHVLPLNNLLQKAFGHNQTNEDSLLKVIKNEATRKIQNNSTITKKQLPMLRHDLLYTLEQNELFLSAATQVNNMSEALDDIINAYQQAPPKDEKALNRCNVFIQNTKKFPDGIEKLRNHIKYDQNIFGLKKMDLTARKELLKTLSSNEQETVKKVDLLAKMLGIPQHKETVSFLAKAFPNLYNNMSFDDFKTQFVQQRQQLAQWDATTIPDIATKKELLNLFDSVLHPELVPESLVYKQYKLKNLVASYPQSKEGMEHTFEEFINIYKTIDPKDLTVSLDALNTENLVNLIREDVYNKNKNSMFSTLKTLDEQHCCALLEKCFTSKNNYNYPNEKSPACKAAMVSKILATTDGFDFKNANIKNSLEYNLYYAFIPGVIDNPYTYEQLNEMFDLQRETAKDTKDIVETNRLDQILQAGWQKELEETHVCLHTPFGTTGFAALQEALKDNLEIRSFDPPEGIDEEVKNYIKHITNRNKLYDAIFDYPPEESLEQVLAIYLALESSEERQRCLRDLIKIDNEKEKLIESLLNLAKRLGDKTNATNIATLVSGLVTELIEHGTFIEYIPNLNKLKDENTHIAAAIDIDTTIKNGVKSDLTNQIGHLLPPTSQEYLHKLQQFKEKLEQNPYILDYNFTEIHDKNKVPIEVKNYVQFICLRNNMHNFVKDLPTTTPASDDDLQKFMQYYTDIAKMEASGEIEKNCLEQVLANINNELVLHIIAKDAGSYNSGYLSSTIKLSCQNLKNLNDINPSASIALLKHCFTIDSPDAAEKKAKLISQILKIDGLFSPENQKNPFVQNIVATVYWSMAPGKWYPNKAYDNFDKLKQNLNSAITKYSNDAHPQMLEKVNQAMASVDISSTVTPELDLSQEPLDAKKMNLKEK